MRIPGGAWEGQVAIVEHTLRPRALAAPLNRHSREDELSIVLTGRMGALLGQDVVEAGGGAYVWGAEGTSGTRSGMRVGWRRHRRSVQIRAGVWLHWHSQPRRRRACANPVDVRWISCGEAVGGKQFSTTCRTDRAHPGIVRPASRRLSLEPWRATPTMATLVHASVSQFQGSRATHHRNHRRSYVPHRSLQNRRRSLACTSGPGAGSACGHDAVLWRYS